MNLLSQLAHAVPLARHLDRTASLKPRLFDTCAALLALGAILVGCTDGGTKRQPDVFVAAIHAAPSFGPISFLRERRLESTLNYRSGEVFAFEADQYDFNVEVEHPGATERERVATFSQTLSVDTAYYFILAESAGGMEPLIVTRPKPDPNSDDAEVSLVHAAPSLAGTDVYLTAPGADLTAANPIGTVDFSGDIGPLTVAPGDYVLSLTEAGNPANVLLASPTQTFEAGEPNMFVVNDGAGEGVAPYSVTRFGMDVIPFVDANTQAGLRAIVAAPDKAPRDVVLEGAATTPLFAGLPFATVSDYATVAPGTSTLQVTPAGNPGVVELEITQALLVGRLQTLFVAEGETGLDGYVIAEDYRPIDGEAHLRIYNGASQFDVLDFFVVTPAGTDITNLVPTSELGVPGTSAELKLAPGDYELTVRAAGPTVVAGPVAITLADGGRYSLLAVDGADAASADIVYFDDFTN